MPFIEVWDACWITVLISHKDVGRVDLNVKSTTLTLATGTRSAIPVILPASSGIKIPNILAAPVDAGIILIHAALPSRKAFLLELSTSC